ncbi:MAG: hypothetical protein R3F34_00485 [Planctomycetota bacterium]
MHQVRTSDRTNLPEVEQEAHTRLDQPRLARAVRDGDVRAERAAIREWRVGLLFLAVGLVVAAVIVADWRFLVAATLFAAICAVPFIATAALTRASDARAEGLDRELHPESRREREHG